MKQPVYIRSDFANLHVELTSDQVARLVEFVRQLEKEPADDAAQARAWSLAPDNEVNL